MWLVDLSIVFTGTGISWFSQEMGRLFCPDWCPRVHARLYASSHLHFKARGRARGGFIYKFIFYFAIEI